MENDCDNCKKTCEVEICLDKEWFEPKCISLPILNGLTPTVESCTMKVLEEVGELMQLIGKGQGKSGEKGNIADIMWAVRSVEESMDTAQSAITMACTLCEEYGIDINEIVKAHEEKLREKGYLK